MASQALQIEKWLFPLFAFDGSNYMTRMVHVWFESWTQSREKGRRGRNKRSNQHPISNQVKPMHHQSRWSQSKPSLNSCLIELLSFMLIFTIGMISKVDIGNQRLNWWQKHRRSHHQFQSWSIVLLINLKIGIRAQRRQAHMIDLHTNSFLCLIDCVVGRWSEYEV